MDGDAFAFASHRCWTHFLTQELRLLAKDDNYSIFGRMLVKVIWAYDGITAGISSVLLLQNFIVPHLVSIVRWILSPDGKMALFSYDIGLFFCIYNPVFNVCITL